MKWGDRYVTLMLVGLGLTLLMVIAIIVAATVPSLRAVAAGVVVVTILARVRWGSPPS